MGQQTYKKGDFIGQKYEVIDILGEGGFGVVYLVYLHDLTYHSFYALKTFKDEFLSEQAVKDRFRKEAQIWIDIGSHPYLVKAYLVDNISGRLFIASEYIAPERKGGPNSLDSYLKLIPFDLAQSLKWAIQFCHGMEYAYAKGIRAHRDIKPSNIMIDQNLTVKITDFGLAGIDKMPALSSERQQKSNVETPLHTMLGTSIGTPEYMPPEQFTDFSACDERSDIYSFGIVLYQMASNGKLPFVAENSEYRWMALKHLHSEKPVPVLNSPLFPIIQKCLQKESNNRYPSFESLRTDLEVLLKRQTGEIIRIPRLEEQQSWEWNNKGLSFVNLSKFEQAITCYDEAIKNDPKNSGAWDNKGNALRLMSRHIEAMDCYNNAIKINPSNARAWINKGSSLSSLGQFDDSLQCLYRALDIKPINMRLGSMVVAILAERTSEIKPAEIKAICKKIISLNLKPYDVDGLFNLGLCYLQIEGLDNALELFLQAEQLAGDDSGIWFQLMEVYFKKQDPYRTIKYCDKLISAKQHIEEAVNKKSRVLSYTGKYGQAVSLLKETLANYPKMSFLWFTLSELQEQNNDFNEALTSAEKCLKLLMQHQGSNHTSIENIKYRVEMLKQKTSTSSSPEILQALRQLKKAEVEFYKQKQHADAVKRLVQLYLNAGDKKKALFYCDMLIKTTNYITDFGNKALVMAHFGDYHGAVDLLTDILKEWPQVDALWYVLSNIHEQHGNLQDALRAAIICREALLKSANHDKQNMADIESKIRILRNK